MRCLNLGCGSRFHPEWENLDFQSWSPQVRAHDLRTGIPFPDETFDVVYHSHVLEHFAKDEAPAFLRECGRVLKAGGVLRVAVPDLERIARLYLEALDKARAGVPGWQEKYDWMMLELYDQTVRKRTGGSCLGYFQQEPIPNWDFIVERVGAEAKAARRMAEEAKKAEGRTNGEGKWEYVRRNPGTVMKNKLAKAALSAEDYAALQEGRFRRSGEVHQWMYDGYSLGRLLEEAGFRDAKQCAATESRIANWAAYCLDNEADGRTYKPDSLFMEAVKP